MASEADIPVAVCEIKVVNAVDNISSSLEKKSNHPKVEEENFLIPPSTHSQVNNAVDDEAVEVAKESEENGDSVSKESSKSDFNSEETTEQNGDAVKPEESTEHNVKALSQAADLQKQSFESCPSIISSSMEDEKIIDKDMEVPENLSTGEAHYEINNVSPKINEVILESDHADSLLLSPKLVDQPVEFAGNEETSMEEIQKNAEESDHNGDSGTEMKDGDKIDYPDATNTSSSDQHGIDDSFSANTTLTKEIVQETSNKLIKEATIDAQEQSLESCPPIVLSPIEEGSKNTVVQEDTSEYTNKEITDENLSIGEAHYEINNVAPEMSELAVKSNHTIKDGSDTLLLSPKLDDQQVEVVANEEAKVDEKTQQNGEETDGGVAEECSEASLAVTSEIKESQVSENEQSSLVIEHPDSIEVSSEEANLHGNTIETEETTINEVVDQQKESQKSFPPIVSNSPDEGSMNADIQETTRDHMDDIVEEVDKYKEVLESRPTTVSTEDAKENSLIKLDGSENKNKDDLGKESEEMPLAREISDESKFIHENQFEDGDSKKVELCDNDRSMLLETESRTENTEDLLHATSEDSIAPDMREEIETTSAMEEQTSSTHLQDTRDKISDEGTVEAAEAKEDTLENVTTIVSKEKTEDNSITQFSDQEVENEEHLEKDNSVDEVVVKDEVKIEDGNAQLFVTESILLTEKPSDSFEDVKIPDLEATGILHNQIPADNLQGIQKEIDEKTQQLQNISTEDSDTGFLIEVDDSEMKHDTNLEEEMEIPSVTEASDEDSIADESTVVLKPKTADECLNEVEKTADYLILENAPEDHKTSTSSEGIETISSVDEQTLEENSQSFTSNKELAASQNERLEDNSVSQVDCSVGVHEDSPIEETNARESRNIDEPKNGMKYELEDEENRPEADGKKLIDTLQVKPEDIKHDKEEEQVEKHNEEEILTADTQESCDLTQERTVDEKNEVDDGSQKPSSAKAIPFEEETNIEYGLVKEEVYVESLQVANEHATSSVQDTEESHSPTTDSQGTVDGQKDGKTLHLADPKEETLDYKNHATTPCDDNSTIQVDKITSSTDAPKDDGEDSTLVRQVPEIEYPVESSLEAPEEIIAFDSCQETEISSTEKQIPDSEDISTNKITEETTEATGEEIQEIQDIAKSVPQEVEDGSQKSYLLEGPERNIDEHELKAESLKNEKDMEDTLINEDASIELPHAAADDNKEPFLSEAKETNPQDEQIIHANPAGLTEDNRIINQIVFEKDTPADEVGKEIESADVKATPTEEGYLNDLQLITAVNLVAAHQDQSCAEDLDVNKDVIGYIPEVSNDKQHESSIVEVSEEHITTSHGHDTSMESVVLEKNNDQVDGEANSCGDKTDSEKIQVLDETLAETDPESTEVQVPHGEKDAVLILHEAEIDQKHIPLSNASEANGEEKIDSNNCEETSADVALEDDSTSNYSQEPRKETKEETEEVHKQESELQVQESSLEQIERDAQLCASDSGIIETADRKESNFAEGETNNQEQNEKTKSFSDDTKPTEEELEETVANDLVQISLSEKELANQEEPCTVKTATEDDEEIKIDEGVNDEKEAYEENIANICSKAPDMIEARDTDAARLIYNSDSIIDATEGPMVSAECIDVNERSVTDLETKFDDEAPQTEGATPLSAQGQDVGEYSNYPGSLINEAAFAPGDNKSAYESNNEALENCDIISEKEGTKIGEENLKAEIISDKALGDAIFQQEKTGCEKETLKEQLLRNKAEDEDIKDQGSCEEVITESHQDDEVKQEQQKNNNKTVEAIKDGNEAEKVPEVSEEANDKVPQDLEDEFKQEQQESSNETVEFIKDGNETEKASEVSEEKVLTNEGIEGPKSIEEPMDTGKARELDIASVTDTCDSIKEGVKIAMEPDEETEEHSDNSDEVEPQDEENTMILEGKSEGEAGKPDEDEDKEAYTTENKKLDHFTSQTKGISECAVSDGAQDIPADNDNSTMINKFCEEDDPRKSTEFEVTGQASEATTVRAEVQEEKAGTHLGADDLKATPEVEEVNDKCKELTNTSMSVEPPVIDAPKIRPDLQNKLHDNIRDSEVKIADKDDAVNLHSLRDISEDVQESSKESFEGRDPEEKIETSKIHEPVTEEQKLGRGNEDVYEEEKKINCIPNLLESSSCPETEKVHQSSVEDAAQHDRKERSQQIDSPPFLQQASSDVKTSEKDLLACVKEPEASPLPSNDKHVVLEADDKKNLIPENLRGEKNLSAEYLQGEYELVKPSKVKQEEAECESEEKREGKPEPQDPTSHNEELHAENTLHENSKTDDEQKIQESASEALVMVDMGDADVKVAHKKSHNILSGVGSKVKHSIAKVKKAITGKSSHPKTPSPKKGTIEN